MRTQRLRSDVEERAPTLEAAERDAEDRAHAEARKLLMDARAEVETAIGRLKAAVDQGEDVDDAATEARRAVERAAGRHREARKGGKQRRHGRGRSGSRAGAGASTTLDPDVAAVGVHVRIRSTGARGRIAEVRDERALVEAGALRFEVALDDLEPIDAPAAEPSGRRGGWSGPETETVRTEIDLRGLRVDEMQLELERALDAAVLEDLGHLRIIHGKGTGALRQRVSEILSTDRRVRDCRMGFPAEGGAGVTVVDLGGAR